jgi:hypothetical protein
MEYFVDMLLQPHVHLWIVSSVVSLGSLISFFFYLQTVTLLPTSFSFLSFIYLKDIPTNKRIMVSEDLAPSLKRLLLQREKQRNQPVQLRAVE